VLSVAQPSLLRRLLVRIGLVALGLVLVGGSLSYLGARHYSDEVHDRWLYDSARTLASQVRFVAQQPSLDLPEVALEMFIWDEKDEIFYEVASSKRGRIAGNAHFPHISEGVTDLRGEFFDTSLRGKPLRAVTVAIAPPAGQEVISVTVAETLNKRTSLAREILLATIPVQLLLMLGGALALWWSVKSGLRAVSDTAAVIRARDPLAVDPVHASSTTPVEIEPLIAAINDLLQRVEAAQLAQQRFVANAAHQLRTPVSALQVQIERALLERDAQGRATALVHVKGAVKRLGRLLHQLLMLARVEPDGQARLSFGACDLTSVARRSVERHDAAAVAAGCDLGYAGPSSNVMIRGEPTLLDEMLSNLIENALQYGGRGARVTVGVQDDPPRLWVEDDGPGIAPSERGSVFDRFYRSAGSVGNGCGLGLAIVKEIAERHHSTVSLDTGPDGHGTRVTITYIRIKAGRPTDVAMASQH
jgi:two-component system, OmpR family, sensor histidine kinase TctE